MVEIGESTQLRDPALSCVVLLARFLGTPADSRQIIHDRGKGDAPFSLEDLSRTANRLGLIGRIRRSDPEDLHKLPLPAIVELVDGDAAVLLKIEDDADNPRQPAQTLMVIVPSGSEVEVEAQILNRDIGFVREGQPVRVKFEAFPFTDYGWIDGTVANISRDAIQDERLGLIYTARVHLSRNYIMLGDRRQPIGPGMAVQAEVRTGRRRIIQYLLSPISQTVSEAGKER